MKNLSSEEYKKLKQKKDAARMQRKNDKGLSGVDIDINIRDSFGGDLTCDWMSTLMLQKEIRRSRRMK